MTIPLFQVNAFTNRPFSGNPAAICLLKQETDSGWMQAVAAEMNLSETAFVRPLDQGFELRWFTPTVEVDLCGHATLATAHILWQQGELTMGDKALFQTRSGLLTAELRDDQIMLDFPATPAKEVEPLEELFKALGLALGDLLSNGFDYLIPMTDEDDLRRISPDFSSLKTIEARGIIVTAPSQQKQYDFISRFFGPASGIDEDPVTGSAHCTLAPYWAERLGKRELFAYQASARGGEMGMSLVNDRVRLSGQAVTMFTGSLMHN